MVEDKILIEEMVNRKIKWLTQNYIHILQSVTELNFQSVYWRKLYAS